MTTPTQEALMALADEFAQAFSDRFDSVIHGDGSMPTPEAARAALASAIAEALQEAYERGQTDVLESAREEFEDAERYRWVREAGGLVWFGYAAGEDPKNASGVRVTGQNYDAAIDAARSAALPPKANEKD